MNEATTVEELMFAMIEREDRAAAAALGGDADTVWPRPSFIGAARSADWGEPLAYPL